LNIAASGHESGEVSIFDFSAGRLIKTIVGAHGSGFQSTTGVSQVKFANNGLHLISGGNDGSIKIWDLRTYKLL
jgi:WD40 repeat protein